MSTHWRLPKGVDEVLPPQAWELELLRRRVLDVFVSWGYDYLEPPVIEYLDALLVGSGEDLDLQTLKVVDQSSGRQLGVRADMTSQAVRVDAHSLPSDNIQRFCYSGPVVFANPQGNQTSRVPLKAGAEIFGASGIAADAEVIGLMLQALDAAGMQAPVLLLGHMGIYRGLVARLIEEGSLDPIDQGQLFSCIQRKGARDIAALLGEGTMADMMIGLPDLMGDAGIFPTARALLQAAPPAVQTSLAELESLAALVAQNHPQVDMRIDVSELSGYGYHNGPVFAVYHPEHGSALAQGGRYDGVGEVFGRGRPATGFDLNLKKLMSKDAVPLGGYFAPYVNEDEREGLNTFVRALRAEGNRVVVAVNEGAQPTAGCEGVVVQDQGQWQIQAAVENTDKG
ncbi:MAG: ATP phosphoribosyltransferase regulatory subunit [Gammaproteobacteria bacterium]